MTWKNALSLLRYRGICLYEVSIKDDSVCYSRKSRYFIKDIINKENTKEFLMILNMNTENHSIKSVNFRIPKTDIMKLLFGKHIDVVGTEKVKGSTIKTYKRLFIMEEDIKKENRKRGSL